MSATLRVLTHEAPLSVNARGLLASVGEAPPAIDARGVFAPLGGGAFQVKYHAIDARSLSQLRQYQSFLKRRYPGWATRFETDFGHDDLSVKLTVFPARLATAFMASSRDRG